MNAKSLLIIILCFGTSCGPYKEVDVDDLTSIKFNEIRYGICSTTNEVATETIHDSLDIKRTLSSGFELIEQTDTIPSILGLTFGLEYEIETTPKQFGYVKFEQVWIFPQTIVDAKGSQIDQLRYTADIDVNYPTYSTYALEKDYELVKGQWKFQLYLDGKLFHERTFYLI